MDPCTLKYHQNVVLTMAHIFSSLHNTVSEETQEQAIDQIQAVIAETATGDMLRHLQSSCRYQFYEQDRDLQVKFIRAVGGLRSCILRFSKPALGSLSAEQCQKFRMSLNNIEWFYHTIALLLHREEDDYEQIITYHVEVILKRCERIEGRLEEKRIKYNDALRNMVNRVESAGSVDGLYAGTNEAVCLECSESLRSKESAVLEKCAHSFCEPCIRKSLEKKRKCPKCKRAVDAWTTVTNVRDFFRYGKLHLFVYDEHEYKSTTTTSFN